MYFENNTQISNIVTNQAVKCLERMIALLLNFTGKNKRNISKVKNGNQLIKKIKKIKNILILLRNSFEIWFSGFKLFCFAQQNKQSWK